MTLPFTISDKILNLSVEIPLLMARIELNLERNLYLRKANRLKSIQSSLAIENNSLTLEQVTAIIEGKRVLGKPQEIQEVRNAFEAYEEILTYNPYKLSDFLKAHRLMTQQLVHSAGQFRQKDVGIFDNEGKVVHMGARPQFVEALVEELFQWGATSQVHPLIKSCVIHYEIEMIHPFEDGNGRLGRLWQNVVLSQWNPIFAWLPMETLVYENQQGYYDALACSDRANDSTAFIEFMLAIIHETLLEQSTQKMSDISSDKMSDKDREVFNLILSFLSQHEFLTNKDAVKLLGKSEATVRRYLNRLTELELLMASGKNRSRKYQLMDKNSHQ